MFKILDSTGKGVVWLSLLILLESVQLLIILGIISSFIPIKMDSYNVDFFPIYESSLTPNRQMLMYHLFIMASIGAQAIGIYAFKVKLGEAGFQAKIKQWLFVNTLWVLVQCYAIFKILIYKGPAWAWDLFYFSSMASLLSRIFWVEISRWWGQMDLRLQGQPAKEPLGLWLSGPWWTALFVVVESIQMVIVLNWLLGHFYSVQPVFLFGIFILSYFILWCLAAYQWVRIEQLRAFTIAEVLLTYFLLSALFKMVIYDYRPILATNAYHVLLVLAVLNKVCWPFFWQSLRRFWAWITAPRNLPTARTFGDYFFALFIILTIYIPDTQAVLAKMFFGDEFIHTGSFIMSPGWAYVSGCLLDVDVISRYGLGVPIVVGALAKALGGYSYLNVFLVILWIAIIYYLLCYVFLRVWLKSFMLAVAAILTGIKTQLFYTLSYPQPFTYPSATPVRFMLDIVFMFCIWGHLNSRRWIYLALAAVCAGASFFCVPETGIYLATAFYAYLALLAMVPDMRASIYGNVQNRVKAACCALLVPGSAFLLMWSYLGSHLFTKEFWFNFTEFYHVGGSWDGPFYGGLQYGQFWDLLIGMAFPLVYILTILIIGTLCVLRKLSHEHLVAVVLSVYGLMTHHYYVIMATANNYYPRGLPFVFIIFYWVSLGLNGLEPQLRRRLSVGLVAFCAYCLWTNQHYLSYPNIFNFSRNPMVDPMVAERLPDRRYYFNHRYVDYPEELKLPLNSLGEKDEGFKFEKDFSTDKELKAYYQEEISFSKDAALIQSLVPPQLPVALLSSYDTEMLMQADRKPLFYYFRIFGSRPLRMRNFGAMDIWTKSELYKTIDQLKGMPSDYLFMERIFLSKLTPTQYAKYDPALMGMLDYVKSHYQPYAYGKFLVAMKRVP